MGTITAATTVYTLQVIPLFPAPQQLQGFAADDIFDTDPLVVGETIMGVDGTLSGGFVFEKVRQGISLQADSASNAVFDAWFAAEQAAKDKFPAVGTVTFPTISTKWALSNGFLVLYPPIPNAGRLLRPRKFFIEWNFVSPALT